PGRRVRFDAKDGRQVGPRVSTGESGCRSGSRLRTLLPSHSRRHYVSIAGVLLRRVFPLLLVPLVLAGCGGGARPNILLIVFDTSRADRFPFDGYARPTAPNLKALASEGAVYTQAFSPAP